MPVPDYVVEIRFGSSDFVDVSQHVQSISLDRGISNQLEDYSAGSVSVTFVNNARVFDPLNTSSPLWYGAGGYTIVQPGGRVRVKANNIVRFTGFIQDWSFTFDDAGFDGKATLNALDEMYRVGNAVFTGGQAWQVESTSDRMKTVFNYNGFGAAEYADISVLQLKLFINGAKKPMLSLFDQTTKSMLNLSAYEIEMVDSVLLKEKPKKDYRRNYSYYADGLINVGKAGKWGFLDKSGKIQIPFQFEFATVFSNGKALVKRNTEWFYIDKAGKRVPETEVQKTYSDKELPPIR